MATLDVINHAGDGARGGEYLQRGATVLYVEIQSPRCGTSGILSEEMLVEIV